MSPLWRLGLEGVLRGRGAGGVQLLQLLVRPLAGLEVLVYRPQGKTAWGEEGGPGSQRRRGSNTLLGKKSSAKHRNKSFKKIGMIKTWLSGGFLFFKKRTHKKLNDVGSGDPRPPPSRRGKGVRRIPPPLPP